MEVENLRIVLEKAKYFHGHICPYLALGIKASTIAMNRLGIKRAGLRESIGERVLAIVECNNCFTDGVQVATGCTMGNNSLIYLDLGKNAVTLIKRGSWKGVRVYVDADKVREKYFSSKGLELFEKVVIKGGGDENDIKTLAKIWEETGYKLLEIPESEFKIEEIRMSPIERAPIFESVRCHSCGELAMKTRITYINGKPYCLKCSRKEFYALIGRGIVKMKM
ncbi:formylmethanofuran dehydrogenase [Candidatus Geothermarchaeota archaeon]|nr:MAG: formylmethanofuran dehydrogenase [Candidatus Geothermarchaeota archaeon]HEW93920.1 formylmethanofuran dehydrogenase [Thermoprotei archaeon]